MVRQFFLFSVILIFLYGCSGNIQQSINDIGDFSATLTDSEIAYVHITPEIMWKLGRLAGGVISPDGKQVLYTVLQYDAKSLKKTSNVYVVSIEGGEPVKITEDRFVDVSATWTPDGKKVAFLSNRYGDMQIWLMNADGSERTKLTHVDGGIDAFQFSPNGKQLWYTSRVKLEESVCEKYPDLDKANAIATDNLMYRHWNRWTDYTYSHIFIASVNGDVITKGVDIMDGEHFDAPISPYFNEKEIAWSPDNTTLAYTCKKLTGKDYAISTNSDIYLYNAQTGETTNVTINNLGYDKYPVFSTDGSKLAYMSMETPGFESDKERLMVLDLQSGDLLNLNQHWDQNAHNYIWSDDGAYIYFISGKQATYQIYKVNISEKKFSQITKGQHDYVSFSKVGNALVGSKTTHQMAAELFVIDEKTGAEQQLTFINQPIYSKIRMGHTEPRWVKTTDGKDMLVWLIFPPNFDKTKKYPTLLYCQGGPQSAVSQFFSYRWNFAIMAANDYVVVAPNRRGLPSFGQEWNAQISTDYYGQNMDDYLSAIDALSAEPYIDENRLGAVGASYGGFSVYYLAGHHQKRFKAFIAHCGMFNMESFYATTEETFFPNHDIGGAYWELNNEVAQKSYAHSPHKFVQNWDTPIMIIHGGNDFRVPYTESLQAFNVAQLRGVPSRLLYFPDESHFVTQPQNAILWQREFFSWLNKYLKEY